MIMFLSLLGAIIITKGAPATDHHTEVTLSVKRDVDCAELLKECRERD